MTATMATFDDDPRFLRQVLDASRLLVLVVDRAGTIQHANRAACETAGLSPTCGDAHIWELTSLPVERNLLQAGFSPFRPEAFPSGVMFHLVNDATSRLVDWDVQLMGEGHDADLVVLTGVDVTDRLASQERLRETEAFQRRVLDRLPAIVWTTDRDLRTTFSAGGGLAALGLASGEVALMGTPVSSYFQTDDPDPPRHRLSPPGARGRVERPRDGLVRALLPGARRAAQGSGRQCRRSDRARGGHDRAGAHRAGAEAERGAAASAGRRQRHQRLLLRGGRAGDAGERGVPRAHRLLARRAAVGSRCRGAR